MNQTPEPQNSQPSSASQQNLVELFPEPKTWLGKRTKIILENIYEPIDLIGYRLMGYLWRSVVSTFQETFALYILLKLSGWIAVLIGGKEYSSFSVCQTEEAWSINWFVCYGIVVYIYLFWFVILGVITGRLWHYINSIVRNQRGR